MALHDLNRDEVAKLIMVSPATVSAALVKPEGANYKPFTDKNINHLKLAINARDE